MHQEALLQADVVLFKLEVPVETVEWAIGFLYENKKTTILNPAPAGKLPDDLLKKATYITPNQHECPLIFDSEESIEALMKQLPNKLIVTEGEKGVRFFDGNSIIRIPSIKVKVVDTTGAGDSFNGALAVALAEGKLLDQAIDFANIAAGLSVTRIGAQGGMATRQQVEKYLR